MNLIAIFSFFKGFSKMISQSETKSFVFKPEIIEKHENPEVLGGPDFKPRSGHRIVVYRGNVYSIGGYSVVYEHNQIFGVELAEVWKYNIATNTWKYLQTTGERPSTFISHGVASVANQVYVHGGTSLPFGENTSNSVFLLNLDTKHWKKLKTSGPKPKPMYGQGIGIQGNKLYAVGGTTGFQFSIEIHCLDLSTMTWELLYENDSSMSQPPERYRHEIAIYDDKIYVIGGGTVETQHTLNPVPVFNMRTKAWETQSSAVTSRGPIERSCHGCIQYDKNVYILGGLANNEVLNDFWHLDLETLKWKQISSDSPQKIPSVFFHGMAVSEEGQMFVFGGKVSTKEEKRTSDIHSTWIRVASLSAISWDAIKFYMPDIAKIERKNLYELGIPMQYLDEIDS